MSEEHHEPVPQEDPGTPEPVTPEEEEVEKEEEPEAPPPGHAAASPAIAGAAD